jgi:hypothetical protein
VQGLAGFAKRGRLLGFAHGAKANEVQCTPAVRAPERTKMKLDNKFENVSYFALFAADENSVLQSQLFNNIQPISVGV